MKNAKSKKSLSEALGCLYIIQGVLTVELQLVDCLLEKNGFLLLFTTLSCSMLFLFEFPFLAEFSSTLRLFVTKKWRVLQQKKSEKGILIIIMTISLLSRKKTFLLVHLQAPTEIIKNFFLILSFILSVSRNLIIKRLFSLEPIPPVSKLELNKSMAKRTGWDFRTRNSAQDDIIRNLRYPSGCAFSLHLPGKNCLQKES